MDPSHFRNIAYVSIVLHIPGYNGLPPFSADMEENGNEESEERVGPVFV